MGSKKHKKDSKKKKHRSRSRSPLDNGEERERKRHRKHKDRKKDRSPDVEEVPVDSHLRSRSRSDSSERARARDRERRGARENHTEYAQSAVSGGHAPAARARSPSPVGAATAATSGGAHDSLSVEDTNRLRAKLGLKPLEQAEKPAEDGKLKDDLGEFYHRPAADIAKQRKQDKLRERLEVRQEKRKLEQKLQADPLGAGAAGSDDEDAAAWVRKSRESQKLKQEAAKRAAMLDELDAEFGVGALVAADAGEARASAYGSGHLRGLRVAHDINQIAEERETILTLEDKEVLADSAEDVLVNVNMVDDQRYKKNILERKKALAGYQAYDDSTEALGLPRSVLGKYDDEIDQGRASRDAGFVLGDEDAAMAAAFRDEVRRSRAMGALGVDGVNRRLESLWMPEPQIATEYYDEHEMQAKFKKFKKKGKIRKKAKHEPIDVEAYDAADAPLDTDDTDIKPSSVALAVDEDEVEPDGELQAAVARARRLRLAAAAAGACDGDGDAKPIIPKVEDLLSHVKSEPSATATEEETEADPEAMVLDATAEFCRTLGDIPTYGQAGNRDHHAEIMELEREEAEEAEAGPGADGGAGAWSRVDVGSEKPPDLAAGSLGGLEAEPALGAGVMGALRLALSKGYLEKAGAAPPPRSNTMHLLAARHYSIEDKTYGEDDKHGRRERGYSGPVQEFREKSHFRPAIKLEYVDDDGRPLCPKEAFRYLSHKFHGKGPGKNKQEKRIKKAVQEGLMKKMSSTDTPLNTLQMLQDKQRETHSPYVVLSGAKRDAPH